MSQLVSRFLGRRTPRLRLLFAVACVGAALLPAAHDAHSAPAPVSPVTAAGKGSPATAGRQAWLGIAMQPVAGGVLITQVSPTSPAERAQLKVGDRIVKVAGNGVAQPEHVQRAVAARVPGDSLTVTVDREGREVIFRIDLAERPDPDALARATYVGKPAPSLVGLVTVNGPPLTTAALKNRVVVIDFWAVWCVPCRLSMPALSSMQARYGAQGLTVLSITGDPAERAAGFARDLNLRTSIIVDPEGKTSQGYGVSVLPTTFVIDKRGVVRDVALGFDSKQEAKLDQLVRDLLAEPNVPDSPAADAGVVGGGASDAGAPKRAAGK